MKVQQVICAVALVSTSALSVAPAEQTTYVCKAQLRYEYDAKYIPVLRKTCEDFDLATERCSSFAVYAAGDRRYAFTDAMAGLRRVDGFLEFKPVGLQSFDLRTGCGWARHWVVYLIDNSGSPSRAEEAYIVINSTFKPVSKRLTYAQKEQFLKSIGIAASALLDETLECEPTN